AVHGLGFVGYGIGVVAAERAGFVHRKLNGYVRRRGVGLGEREHTERQPIAARRRLGRRARGGDSRGLRVILRRAALILAVHVHVAVLIGDVVAVVVVNGLRIVITTVGGGAIPRAGGPGSVGGPTGAPPRAGMRRVPAVPVNAPVTVIRPHGCGTRVAA